MSRNRIIAVVVGALVVIAAIVAIVLVVNDDSDDAETAATTTTTAAGQETTTTSAQETTTTTEATTTPTEVPEPLVIMVTNDDGVMNPGIAALSDALAALDNVEIHVIAPAENQTGSGDAADGGPYEPIETQTATGRDAIAINGKPADTVFYALNELGLEPHVVLAGSNDGNNLGPFIQVSGTVGAARTAAREGVPGVAVSNSIGEPPQFENSVSVAVKWVEARRADLLSRTFEPIIVTGINGPTCEVGETKGSVEVPVALEIGDRQATLGPIDCAVEAPQPADDVDGVNGGWVTISTFDPELSMFG